MPRSNTEADFWGRIAVAGEDDCWMWQGSCSDRGYGKTFFGGKDVRAHRLAYALSNNGAMPSAVCHSCDTPGCCNPKHLFAGTNGSNNKDRAAKGRSWRPVGEAHPAAKLTSEMVAAIRAAAPTKSYAQIGREFGVHRTTARQIALGLRWA